MFEAGSKPGDESLSSQEAEPSLRDDSYTLPNRRPTHILNTPALIAHHVFWYSPQNPDVGDTDPEAKLWARLSKTLNNAPADAPLSPRHSPDVKDAQDDPRLVIAQSLNEYLCIFRANSNASELGRIPIFTNNPLLLSNPNETREEPQDLYVDYRTTLAFEGKVQGLPYECIIDIFPDHYTQSFRIFPNAIRTSSEAFSRSAHQRLAATIEAADILKDLVKGEVGKLEQTLPLEPRKGEDRFKDADKEGRKWLKTLYQQIWDEFFNNLKWEAGARYDVSPQAFSERKHPDHPGQSLPGSLVGVFKSLVIRPMAIEEQEACHNEYDQYGAVVHGDRSKVLRNVPAGVINHPNERNEIALSGFNAEPLETARHLIKARLTQHLNHRSILFGLLLGYRAGTSWIGDSQSGNAALSLMLDGLAIHGTTLGMHRHGSPRTSFNEVHHFIIYGGPSRQQLGRLIRTLHAVGENRFLVLRGFSDIDLAGRRLQALRQDLAKAEGALNKETESETVLSNAEDTLKATSQRLVELKEVQNDGGLTHRLSRLRTNEKNLLRQLAVLRIDRLEGWRPFDEFITRNVLPYVTYLKSVGFTLSVVEQDIQRLDSSILRHRSAIETKALRTTVTYIKDLIDKQSQQNDLVLGLGYVAASAGLLSVAVPVGLTLLSYTPTSVSALVHGHLIQLVPLGFFALSVFGIGIAAKYLWKGFRLLDKNRSKFVPTLEGPAPSPPDESQ